MFLKKKKQFPPVPDWRPAFGPRVEQVSDRFTYYLDGKRDFAIFTNGTVSILPDGLNDLQAETHAKDALHKAFHQHPDMTPRSMDDGNIVLTFNHNLAAVVLADIVEPHWSEIDKNHQRAITTHEVLITPLGPNVFDDFGKKALFGRCFMFMDAQNPKVVRIVRKSVGL